MSLGKPGKAESTADVPSIQKPRVRRPTEWISPFPRDYGKVRLSQKNELCYYVRGAKDAWIDEIAAETWGDAVVTKPVTVEAMHQWLANNPEAFIAAFQA